MTGKLRDGMYAAYRGSFPKAPHPSFIVLPLADEILGSRPIPIYIVDPDGVDEFQDVAYITGHPDLPRSSGFHVLNHKAIARKASRDLGKRYEDADLVVAHMGGGSPSPPTGTAWWWTAPAAAVPGRGPSAPTAPARFR